MKPEDNPPFYCKCGRVLPPPTHERPYAECHSCNLVWHREANYWGLSPDLSMRDLAQERVKNIFKTFEILHTRISVH
jgi:hypothetical protein